VAEENTQHYASFGSRLLAYILDAFVLQLLQIIIIIPFLLSLDFDFVDVPFDWEAYDRYDEAFFTDLGLWIDQARPLIFAGFITQTLYFSLLESSHLQASLGKLALGIKVVDQHGARLDFLYCLVRNLSKFLSSLIFMLGYLMAAVTKNKQALHDLIAGSYVVRSMPDRDID
jgi:uncharacterized RDD family membrane protein YckC|tara:strand:- start:814 stop:1329 length:516 start_codon:yes stop_codon:yes gene_type:complete